jgi:purine-binding chemotaxis protein CheW
MKKYLVFNVAKWYYAVELLTIKEVVARPRITSIPMTPAHIKGIIKLRGDIISVIDLRYKFQTQYFDEGEESTILICEVNNEMVGFMVDKVTHVTEVGEEDIGVCDHQFIEGMVSDNEKLVLLLNFEKVLDGSIAYQKLHIAA